MTTLIASAVESVPDGDLSFVRPSSVTPARSSRKIVTTRRISSSARVAGGSSSVAPTASRRSRTISTSSSALSGSGSTTVLKRRRIALERSLTPRSRSLAVAITLKPWTAWISSSSSGIGSDFSDRIVISASCTSDGIRVSSSTRASLPASIARYTGPGTSASRDGPSASSRA